MFPRLCVVSHVSLQKPWYRDELTDFVALMSTFHVMLTHTHTHTQHRHVMLTRTHTHTHTPSTAVLHFS